MTNQDKRSKAAADLRQKAEALAREQDVRTEDTAGLSPNKIRDTLYELRVHQIELEMQNEELRTAQAEIEAGRARYFDLYDLAPVGYLTLSEKGLILEANLTAATMLGTARGALAKQPLSRFILKEDQDIYYLHRKQLFESGESKECELQLVKPGGAVFWAHLTANAVQAEDDTPLSRVVISDITERKRFDEALREHDFSESLIETAQTIILVLDTHGCIVRFNPYMEKLVGYDLNEVRGFDWFETFIKPENVNTSKSVFQKTVDNIQTSGTMNPIVTKDGRTILVECNNKALKDKDGRTVGVLTIGQDITERKQAEDKYKQLLNEYETVFQGTQDAMFLIEVTNPNTFRYIRSNQSQARETGFTTEQLAGLTPQELVGDELGDRIAENYRRCVSTGVPISYVETLDLPSGIKTWHTTLNPISQKDKIRFIVGSSKDITAQKKAEEEIRRFKTVADNAMYGNAIADLHGNIVYVNRFFAEIHGYSPEELIGSQLSIFHTSGQKQKVEQNFALLIQEGTFKAKEVWHVHRDGTEFPMLMSSVLLKDEYDNPQYLSATAIDLTAYHQSQQNYQLLFDSTQNGIALHDIICDESGIPVDYRFLSVNPAFEALTGLNADDIIGSSVLEVLPNTEQFWIDTYGRVAQTGESVSFEQYAGSLDKHFGVTAFRPAEDRFACIFQDITERTFAEQHTRIRLSLLEYAQTLSLEELLLRILEEAESLTGSNISFFHFVAEDQKTVSLHTWSARTQEEFCDALGEGNHYSLDKAGVWADCVREKQPVIHNDYASLPHRKGVPEGHAQIIREMVIPVLRGDDIVGVLGVGNSPDDYTKRDKETISYLADMAWEIIEDKRGDEQLNEMQVQLAQMQKMETVGRLAGGIAHDYNNMLSVIMGYTEMAMDKTDPDDPLHKDLIEVMNAAKRSADITRQLLTFARKQSIAPAVLNLNTGISDILEMIRKLIGESIDLHWKPGNELWNIIIDPVQVDQILVNLCINARDAIEDVGNITVETSNIKFDEDYCKRHTEFIQGEFIMLVVNDNGCGMDKTLLAQIFEPFFTTKAVGKGSGLGLPTVYGIVKQNNGFINVYSEPGSGTTFKLYLPRHIGEAESVRMKNVDEIPVSQGETILIVEDESTILNLEKRMLEESGYHVLAVNSPEEAINLVKEIDCDLHLLITDVVMPEMNGKDLAQTLSKMCPDIKVVYMSGYTANVIAHHGVLDTGIHFLQKPFSKRGLAEIVRKALQE